ncbi:dipeptide epimerase [Candidatus Kaiserbacteria bacterium]|nr:dipeptide epimerase [Candidatus Kaiserbacteria bacterium]
MELSFSVETWPVRAGFAISRGAVKEAQVVVATIRDATYQGRGECVPYQRYGDTVGSVQSQISSVRVAIEAGAGRDELQKLLPAGAARNALDCALWDLEAKQKSKTIWELVGIKNPRPMPTCFTISLDAPEAMAEQAKKVAKQYPVLKIKLGADGDEERLRKIREAAPEARLIVDANEGWNENNIDAMLRACESAGVELLEQPVPAEYSNILKNVRTSILLCADESAHTSADIEKLTNRYGAVNIKLDKTGGLTEALAMAKRAREAGLSVMVGCHVSTSLSMAPATVVAQYADYVDLDGPLLLERDREPHIEYRDGMIRPTTPELWG